MHDVRMASQALCWRAEFLVVFAPNCALNTTRLVAAFWIALAAGVVVGWTVIAIGELREMHHA